MRLPYQGFKNEPIFFDGTASSDPEGNPLTYQWDFGDGSTGVGVTPNHTYTSAGSFTVTLIVSDGEAASAPASTTVEVGWNSGSSLVITFSSGTAKREARAFDGDATRAPLLHVEHKIGGTALPE